MAASQIVAEPLTLTGSIGVITGKFNLSEFFEKIGIGKTYISRGRYAEVRRMAKIASRNPRRS